MPDILPNIVASSLVLGGLILIIAVVYQVFAFRRMKNQRAVLKSVHENLIPGKRIMFAGGLFGTVKRVDTDIVEVKLKSGEIIEVSRYAIQQILS